MTMTRSATGLRALLAVCLLASPAQAGQSDGDEVVTLEPDRSAVAPLGLEELTRRADAIVVGTYDGLGATLDGPPVRLRTTLRFRRCTAIKDHPRLRFPKGTCQALDEGGGQYRAVSHRVIRFSDDSQHFRHGHVYALPLLWSAVDQQFRLLAGHRTVLDVTAERPKALGDTSVIGAAVGRLRTPEVMAVLLRAARTR
jgi:hypothetical protein